MDLSPKTERRLALIMAMPRPQQPNKRQKADDIEDSHDTEWLHEPGALEKWTVAMAFNSEAIELERGVSEMLRCMVVTPANEVQVPAMLVLVCVLSSLTYNAWLRSKRRAKSLRLPTTRKIACATAPTCWRFCRLSRFDADNAMFDS